MDNCLVSGQDNRGRFYGPDAKGFPPDLVKIAYRKLAYLDAAAHLSDLRSPPGNRLEALSGDRPVDIACGSMTNSASASSGATAMRMRSKYWIIIEGHKRMIRRGEMMDADFGSAADACLPPVSPGEILLEEFMRPLGLTSRVLGTELGVPGNRISAIVNGSRAVTAETALLLAKRFGTTAELWMNLQTAHDLAVARAKMAA